MSSGADPVRRLVRAADAGTTVAAAAAVLLLIFGTFRTIVGGVPVSLPWTTAAFVGAAIAAIRHAAVPRPSIISSAAEWRDALEQRPALADAVATFLVTRPLVLLVGFVALVTVGAPPAADDHAAHAAVVRTLPAKWDAQWYAGIAAEGYEWQYRFDRQQNLAFFPLYPLTIRAAGMLTGAFRSGLPRERRIAHLTWCGLVISLAAFFWAAWHFASLARECLEEDRARSATLLLAAYPFALFFSAAYTESLFLLSALATWAAFRRGRLVRAAAWGILTGFCRPNGFFIAVPLGLIALGVRDAGQSTRRDPTVSVSRLVVAAAPLAGTLLFTLYLYRLTGVWFAWSRIQLAWGRVFGGHSPGGIVDTVTSASLLELIAAYPYSAINCLGLLFATALIVPAWRRISPAWALFVAINLLAPLMMGTVLSVGRFTSTLFPLFLALAAVLPSRRAGPVAVGFALLQGLFAALFYTWRDVY
jgi:mannosyltransferase PIG-V